MSGVAPVNPSGDRIRVVHPLFQAESGGSTPTSPLQLHIGWTTVAQATRLNELWHSRLPEFTGIPQKCKAFCAEYDGLFYASAIWSPPVARILNYTGRYELRRFAIAPDAPRNTGSRMLKIMRAMIRKELPDVSILISYQDTDAHAGTIYKAAGWKISPCTTGSTEWNREQRPRVATQSTAPKVRWERRI